MITEFGDLIKQCKNLLDVKQGITIQFVNRQANMVAHTRRAAINVWAQSFSTLPSYIALIVFNEIR